MNARKVEPGFAAILTRPTVIAAWRFGLTYMRYSSAAVAGNVTLCWIVFGMTDASGAQLFFAVWLMKDPSCGTTFVPLQVGHLTFIFPSLFVRRMILQ